MAQTLADRAGRALGWSFLSTALARLGTLAIGVALARILGPAQFGTFAVAMVALLAVLSFNELGVSLAIVRWPGEPSAIAGTVATISMLSSAVVYAVCYLGAPAFATLMGDPAATPVVRLLTLCVLVNGVVAVPAALLQRQFRQGRKMIADQVTTWLGAGVSITCALAGQGAMSLAIGQLTGAVAGGILLAAFAPAGLRPGFDRATARDLLRFGLPLAGSSIVVFAVANIDRLIVGAVLGPVPLGFYVLAVNLSNWPVTMFSQPVRQVAPAALARLQHDPPAMRGTFLTTAGLLTAITFPACALLAVAATPVITLVYGSTWAPAAAVLPWLALLGALRIIFELIYDYFVVLANTRVVFAVQVAWLLLLAPAVYLGARWGGSPGAAAAQLAVALVAILPLYLHELRRTTIAPAAFLSRLALPTAVTAVAAAASFAAVTYLPVPAAALAGVAVIGAATLAVLLHRSRHSLKTLRATA
ncbi:lipopolysaccharide biosynthesis protein [Actinoplanes rectilineatus]|uniref:lipopolysaccharide biosynthesis protein n=1 Tax=Actinoplanes rectilineatus TaxID=113571 RepID=UPI0005F2F3AA|nr:lipopolysaccharide biosynthesis protein [Actinoplanes rectilineatus]